MALFRKKKADGAEPAGDMMDQYARMSMEELMEATEVKYQQREVARTLENRGKMITRHLEVVHQPGGLTAIKEVADFMDLGAERPYLDALSDISFSIEEQVGTGNDFFTIWTVTGRH